MLVNKEKRAKQHLRTLPSLVQTAQQVEFLPSPIEFKQQIIQLIRQAQKRIYITALYWQYDEAGQEILNELLQARLQNPQLDIKVFVDWHRAQRNLLGAEKGVTNADWYCSQLAEFTDKQSLFFGVPINTREVFGVLHLKGFIFDDILLYSGASINNVYLQQKDKYRYDRYQKIQNPVLTDSIINFLNKYLVGNAVQPLDQATRPTTREQRSVIREFRRKLATEAQYSLLAKDIVFINDEQLTITPLFGLGAKNLLNQTIESLFSLVQHELVICTPYFNFPRSLQKRIRLLLEKGKRVEIIVGDKIANDFYIPPDQPFKMAGALPYLYEKNLRRFSKTFERNIKQGNLVIRTWKEGDNTYHLKGVWIDEEYILLTGNNLNPRAWRLDAENGLLIHDPHKELRVKCLQELQQIRQHTNELQHYSELEDIANYPEPVRKLLKRFARLKADKIVKMIL